MFGTANSGLVYQQPLVVVEGLTQGTHTLKITSNGVGSTPNLDVDMITFESDLQADGLGPLIASIIQDTDSRFQYSSSWNTSPTNVSLFSNGTGHATTTSQSSVTLSFTGAAVSIFGSVGPNNGQYQAQLDGVTYPVLNGTSWDTFTQVMLYHANDIGDIPHELVIINQPAANSAQTALAIDYAVCRDPHFVRKSW
ncbi:hypothetical protein CONPUDRAFT_167921 [Coniophora puteana RWD-64-598 SS2]|uniref:Uncharacterized protein n=1 Tax=Coniophora puteana (strain RWD-64-598) TaxID=741705 RepID=A0A5M3MFJ9_CONPW|nr:uncharacterized protein CONPUDRAFT_167921 [Coniophora puteana RWD-64-598 SS2]EIW77933.1 hypothetical protein CONPUDRAFT_167921 [Coniophora puteana RWD-64-598 SS2]